MNRLPKEEFLKKVIDIYRKNSLYLGFIPKKRFEYYLTKNQFFINEDGFILTSSLKKDTVTIYCLYVAEKKRSGLRPILSLAEMLPHKKYRVRCIEKHKKLWIKLGLKEIGHHMENSRKRKICTLEGFISPSLRPLTLPQPPKEKANEIPKP